MLQNKIQIVIFTALFLTGCNQSTDLNQLKNEIKTQKENATAFVPKTPKLKQYQQYIYSSGGLKSPFKDTVSEVRIEKKTVTEVKPDLTRKKTDSEKYDLNSFKMLGTIKRSNGKELNAVLGTNNGKVFVLKQGDYIGKDNGKILNITKDQINLEEIIPNGSYRWIKRPATIKMIKNEFH